MVLTGMPETSDGSLWYRFFHERRFVNVRFVHGPMDVEIRTQKEAETAAYMALLAEPETPELTVR